MSDSSAQPISFSLFRRVLSMAKPYRRTLYFTAVLTVVLAPLAIARPKLIQVMVDDYMLRGDVQGMTMLAGILFGVLLLEVVLRYLFLYNADWLGQITIRDLRVRVFNHVTRLNLSYFDKTPIGTSTTRTISDIEAINTIFSEGSITILADLLSIVAVMTIMFITSWKLTLVVLSVFPLLIWGSYQFKESVRKSYEKVRNHIATMNAFLQERITGMRMVQIFNAEAREGRKISPDQPRLYERQPALHIGLCHLFPDRGDHLRLVARPDGLVWRARRTFRRNNRRYHRRFPVVHFYAVPPDTYVG
jgi:ATP-binding cassette subfamily B multidrug efflux pump